MHCLLIYDISHDAKRLRVADVCLDYGLDRIQYSAFEGQLPTTHQQEMMLKIAEILGDKPGSVRLYPLCRQDWKRRKIITQELKA